MTREDVLKRLNDVFQDVFDDDEIQITDATTADDIDDWDSIEHMTLVSSVESEFGIRFSMGETSTMKNVGEMVDIILQKSE